MRLGRDASQQEFTPPPVPLQLAHLLSVESNPPARLVCLASMPWVLALVPPSLIGGSVSLFRRPLPRCAGHGPSALAQQARFSGRAHLLRPRPWPGGGWQADPLRIRPGRATGSAR